MDSKLLIILLFTISIVQGSRMCYKCKGIQCTRTSHNETQMCYDSLDVCVTVFDNFNVVERGCSGEISSNLMKKCLPTNFGNDENGDIIENSDCEKCNENLCNDKGRKEFQCIQCDSKVTEDCKDNPKNIIATPCPIPTSLNSYCFTDQQANQRTIRGCSGNMKHQRECLNNNNCMLCLASDMENCNKAKFKVNDGDGSISTTPKPNSHNSAITNNITMSILIGPLILNFIYFLKTKV